MNTFLLAGMVVSGLFFGWTIGSHYTGATMSMAYGSGVIKNPVTATVLIAVFVILGATFESHNVVRTVGTGIIRGDDMTPLGATVMMLTAALVTAANTWMKWPVSTSQLACSSVVGAAVGMGVPIFWTTTIVFLCVTWIGTPIVSAGLGFLFTHIAGKFAQKKRTRSERLLKYLLFAACCYAAARSQQHGQCGRRPIRHETAHTREGWFRGWHRHGGRSTHLGATHLGKGGQGNRPARFVNGCGSKACAERHGAYCSVPGLSNFHEPGTDRRNGGSGNCTGRQNHRHKRDEGDRPVLVLDAALGRLRFVLPIFSLSHGLQVK